MKKKPKRKRSVTLIEIMIVILLIGLIGGALAFNMRGSVDKGREFKTEQNISRVYDALMLERAKGERSLAEIVADRERVLNECPFVKNGASLLKDAWGNELNFDIDENADDIAVTSTRLNGMNQNNAPN